MCGLGGGGAPRQRTAQHPSPGPPRQVQKPLAVAQQPDITHSANTLPRCCAALPRPPPPRRRRQLPPPLCTRRPESAARSPPPPPQARCALLGLFPSRPPKHAPPPPPPPPPPSQSGRPGRPLVGKLGPQLWRCPLSLGQGMLYRGPRPVLQALAHARRLPAFTGYSAVRQAGLAETRADSPGGGRRRSSRLTIAAGHPDAGSAGNYRGSIAQCRPRRSCCVRAPPSLLHTDSAAVGSVQCARVEAATWWRRACRGRRRRRPDRPLIEAGPGGGRRGAGAGGPGRNEPEAAARLRVSATRASECTA